MIITAGYVDNLIFAWNLVVHCGFQAVNKPLHGRWIVLEQVCSSLWKSRLLTIRSQISPACSSFQYLFQYVVIAIDIVVFLSERRNCSTSVQNRSVIAVAEGVANVG